MLHAKSIALDLEYYENASYYNSLHRAQAEAPYRPVRIVSELAQLGQARAQSPWQAWPFSSWPSTRLLAAQPVVFVSLRFSRYALLAKISHLYQL